MKVMIMTVNLRAEWSHSLKEKRMVVRSIIQKLRNKFNVSVSEVANQDLHNYITIGIASVCVSSSLLDSTSENIINFIEDNTDAELLDIEKDIMTF